MDSGVIGFELRSSDSKSKILGGDTFASNIVSTVTVWRPSSSLDSLTEANLKLSGDWFPYLFFFPKS